MLVVGDLSTHRWGEALPYSQGQETAYRRRVVRRRAWTPSQESAASQTLPLHRQDRWERSELRLTQLVQLDFVSLTPRAPFLQN